MQRTMLAAVYATAERLIAPRYMIQISVDLAFSYTKREHHILDVSLSEPDLLRRFEIFQVSSLFDITVSIISCST